MILYPEYCVNNEASSGDPGAESELLVGDICKQGGEEDECRAGQRWGHLSEERMQGGQMAHPGALSGHQNGHSAHRPGPLPGVQRWNAHENGDLKRISLFFEFFVYLAKLIIRLCGHLFGEDPMLKTEQIPEQ
jgi:hypothetical protein